MGKPVFQCEDFLKQHDVRVYSSNYTLYADMSQRVMNTLTQFTPDIEIYSIDEAFLALHGLPVKDLTEYGRHIRSIVKQWTGIPVSVGIAPSKTLAKIANDRGKKNPECDGVFNVTNHPDIDKILDSFDVSKVWGIGRQYTKFLKKHGINTARQLRDTSDTWIKKHLNVVAQRTVLELRGIPCIELDDMPSPKKAIASTRSFGRKVESLNELREAVASYVSRAAEKLRRQNSAAGCIHVFLQTSPHSDEPYYGNISTMHLPQATAYTPDLIRYAHEVLNDIYRPGLLYQKAGVMLTDIVPEGRVQRDLFTNDEKDEQKRALMKMLDTLNRRWGSNVVVNAASGIQQAWHMRRRKLSPRFTTQWNELPIAKTGGPLPGPSSKAR
jgi:DNA polymerase V